ncbi:hypothetical protein U9M48_037533 [Paspalum notatum var. saurae]|uniref:Uncharacterized protein n=1 Tax=Paspalum notatum var. saurae TaxID=547442 RepID=A0AAQ3XAR1_PASNO
MVVPMCGSAGLTGQVVVGTGVGTLQDSCRQVFQLAEMCNLQHGIQVQQDTLGQDVGVLEVQQETASEEDVLAKGVSALGQILTPSKRGTSLTPVRRSKRREATVDEDSLERAERLVAIKNLESPPKSYFQGYILDKVLESTLKERQKLFEVGIPHVRHSGFGGVREEWLAVI